MSKIYLATQDWVSNLTDRVINGYSIYDEIKGLSQTEIKPFSDVSPTIAFNDDIKGISVSANVTTKSQVANVWAGVTLDKISFAQYLKEGFRRLDVEIVTHGGPVSEYNTQLVIGNYPHTSGEAVVYSTAEHKMGGTATGSGAVVTIDISRLTGQYYIGISCQLPAYSASGGNNYLYIGGITVKGWKLTI